MCWEASPGCEPEYEDFSPNLDLVDDADTFENEVENMDLHNEVYEVCTQDERLDDVSEDEQD